MKVKYMIYNPAGNITALVIGDEYNAQEKELINNSIMKENSKVEQVGFLSLEYAKLTMAGGEFCGNATRCAAKYYTDKNQIKEVEINDRKLEVEINDRKLEVGIDGEQKV